MGVAIGILGAFQGFHMVPTQHVGVYWRFNRLLDVVATPGLHVYIPVITRAKNVYVGIDKDVVPSHSLTHCRSKDGGNFGIRVDVSNRLSADNVIETLTIFGERYDEVTIYNQVPSSVKEVCSNMSSHDIAIAYLEELDDRILSKMRDRQSYLGSSVEIVQVMIVDLQIPPALDAQFANQSTERARVLSLKEERIAESERLRNVRQLYEAKHEQEEAEVLCDARKRVIDAEGRANASRINAEALRHSKEQEALADKTWLTDARVRFTEATSAPLKVLLHQVVGAFWSPAADSP